MSAMVDFLQPIGLYKGMIIPITGGKVLIDDEDYPLVSGYRWHVNDSGYAVWRGIKDGVKRTIRMHRLILNTPRHLVTDHINHDRLDNRKSNIRVCTQRENMQNIDPGKGYWFQKQNNNWVVELRGRHVGVFDSEEEAKEVVVFVRSGGVYKKPQRTHCSHGHVLEDAYDYGKGKRCKVCQSRRSREYYMRRINH